MGYQCYEDIKTQAVAWRAALAAVDSLAEDLAAFFAERPSELLFAACGSPYYLGLANAALWRERLNLRTTVVPSSEIMLFRDTVLPPMGRPILFTASRSGETTETVRAAEAFAERFPTARCSSVVDQRASCTSSLTWRSSFPKEMKI